MKKKFKSLLAIFLVLAFVLTGCGKSNKDSGKSSDSGSKQESSTGKKANEENKGNIVGEQMGGGKSKDCYNQTFRCIQME